MTQTIARTCDMQARLALKVRQQIEHYVKYLQTAVSDPCMGVHVRTYYINRSYNGTPSSSIAFFAPVMPPLKNGLSAISHPQLSGECPAMHYAVDTRPEAVDAALAAGQYGLGGGGGACWKVVVRTSV